MGFCKEFNAQTQDQAGLIIPVEISVFEDRSFTFITKTPPAAVLLKKAAGIETASGEPNRNKVATVKRAQVREIAELKMPDLNAADVEAAMQMVEKMHVVWVSQRRHLLFVEVKVAQLSYHYATFCRKWTEASQYSMFILIIADALY